MNKVIFKWEFIKEYIKDDIFCEEEIVVFIDNLPYIKDNVIRDPFSHEEINKNNKIFVYLQVESSIIIGGIIQTLLNDERIYNFFDFILTFDSRLIEKNQNKCLKFLPYAKYYWIKSHIDWEENIYLKYYNVNGNQDYGVHYKEFHVAFMCGHKNYCPGHDIRHQIWNNQERINIPRRFFYGRNHEGMRIYDGNIEFSHPRDKTEMFKTPMFVIITENNRSKDYFTEKINECILTRTVPIYWGCPNIGDYYNMNGIITFENLDELINIVNNLSVEKYWKMYDYVNENYERFLKMKSFEQQFKDFLRRI